MGRKRVLMIGLLGTFISSVGFGFSKSFASAMFFRSFGGALNGNVGVMRTMISEIVVEKKYQPKAFLVMPVTFNVGVLIGPLLGGWLQDPVHTFPAAFGSGSALGGKTGVRWMTKFPYALPNLVSAMFLLGSVALVFLGLEEVCTRNHPYIFVLANQNRRILTVVDGLIGDATSDNHLFAFCVAFCAVAPATNTQDWAVRTRMTCMSCGVILSNLQQRQRLH